MSNPTLAGLGPFVVLAALVTSGCGGSVTVYPAKGKVTYTDGTAMPGGARLIFQTEAGSGYQVWGDVKPDGTFTLMTADEQGTIQEGAPVGEYRVYVVPVAPEAKGDEDEQDAAEVTSEKYGDPEKSGITVGIKAQEINEVPPIKVEKARRN